MRYLILASVQFEVNIREHIHQVGSILFKYIIQVKCLITQLIIPTHLTF